MDSDMKRLSFLAAIFGFGAAAQVKQTSTGSNSPNIVGSGSVVIQGGVSGVSPPRYRNGVCPHCKTPAPPFKAYAKKEDMPKRLPDGKMGEVSICGPLTVSGYGEVHFATCEKTQERLIRCFTCNNAFFQNSE